MIRAGVLSFRPDVTVDETGRGALAVRSPWGAVSMGQPTAGLRAVCERLRGPGGTPDELADLALAADGEAADLATVYYALDRLARRNALRASLEIDGAAVLRVEPMTPGVALEPAPLDGAMPHRLSRFVVCRRAGEALVAESPLSAVRVVLLVPAAALVLAELARARSAPQVAARAGVAADAAGAIMGALAAAGLIVPTDAHGAAAEDRSPALMGWEFADLLFHSRSRAGRHDYPVGATYPLRAAMPPLPAVKPPMPGALIPLAVPDLAACRASDPPFTEVLERRRSVRAYTAPITVTQLGEFLYRAARVRAVYGPLPEEELFYEASSRPYPAGGAAYDLEIYVTAGTCDGLARAVYHYDPLAHGLRRVNDDERTVALLLDVASQSAARLVVPQVLLTLTSRHLRLSWKYNAIAYATALKNAGALYQTFYLVATAMGLAPCGLGAGHSALVAAATGVDELDEAPVGDFMLGAG
jgi:SagB-type dehydrogenase family enzyme